MYLQGSISDTLRYPQPKPPVHLFDSKRLEDTQLNHMAQTY